MSRRWVEAHEAEFIRDVLRDYCLVCAELNAQFARFAKSQTISFPVMRDLLGTAMNKGLLWRLKDTAHHLFRHVPTQHIHDQKILQCEEDDPLAYMLDWSIGYVFHECIKLKEDAYQHQHYAPQYKALHKMLLHESLQAVVEPLSMTLDETCESMDREIKRIRYILASSRKLLCFYLIRHKENTLLARLIHDNNSLVQDVFAEEFETLVNALYGTKPQRLQTYAALALMDGGRHQEALDAVTKALSISNNCAEALALRTKIHTVLAQKHS
ncbi:MAG: hypothetical protein R3Y11_06455 [Pseudomonadota bacterium]